MVRIAIAVLSSILGTWGIILLTPLTPLQASELVLNRPQWEASGEFVWIPSGDYIFGSDGAERNYA
ncbi:MAG: hypothetical protein AB4040_18330 [Synechococcus sp.]